MIFRIHSDVQPFQCQDIAGSFSGMGGMATSCRCKRCLMVGQLQDGRNALPGANIDAFSLLFNLRRCKRRGWCLSSTSSSKSGFTEKNKGVALPYIFHFVSSNKKKGGIHSFSKFSSEEKHEQCNWIVYKNNICCII